MIPPAGFAPGSSEGSLVEDPGTAVGPDPATKMGRRTSSSAARSATVLNSQYEESTRKITAIRANSPTPHKGKRYRDRDGRLDDGLDILMILLRLIDEEL
jgi:hypothetical protein